MIITIARKCGCDADSISRAVAEKYHLHFMDREAIAAGAKEAGCYDEYEEFYSERPVNSLLYSIVMETEEDNVLHDTPARALTFIDRLPLEDGCEGYVIQGRCANFAFQGRDDVVSVFLTANDAFCVDTVLPLHHGVSVRKAKTVVRETNDNRKTYHKYYTGQEWGQAENYDLCLNVAKLGVDGVIAVIDSFIQNRKIEVYIQKPNPWECGFGFLSLFLKIKIHRWKNVWNYVTNTAKNIKNNVTTGIYLEK